MKRPEAIRVIITGGTFDKHYDEITGRLVFTDSHLPEMLRLGRRAVERELGFNPNAAVE